MKSARSSEVEDASSRKSKEPDTFPKSRNLLSKVGRDSGITRRSNCPDVSSLVTFSLELCENHEPNPDLNPGFQKIGLSGRVVTHHMRLGALRKPRAEPGFEPRISKDQLFQFCRHSSLHRQLCGNYGALCQKARNGNCSSITGCRQIVQE